MEVDFARLLSASTGGCNLRNNIEFIIELIGFAPTAPRAWYTNIDLWFKFQKSFKNLNPAVSLSLLPQFLVLMRQILVARRFWD